MLNGGMIHRLKIRGYMIRVLPTFKGYTVDARLRQFRMIGTRLGETVFISFDSDKGDAMLCEYLETLDVNSVDFDEIAKLF